MRIAIIGWGSLIWDPRDLELASEWQEDGPRLPVEFSRVSEDGRLTLVLTEGVPEQPTLWAVSARDRLEEVEEDLEAREKCDDPRGVACWPRLAGRSGIRRYDDVIRNWLDARNLEGAVWTALGPKDEHRIRRLASEDERLEYLRRLERDRRAAAREYIERAPEQIRTPFRDRVRRELGWG